MMKRKNIESERLRKRDVWVERTMLVLGMHENEVRTLLATPRIQSYRVNSLKSSGIPMDLPGNEIIWDNRSVGYSCNREAITKLRDSEHVMSGEVYIQNAASWLPVRALDPQPSETILDVCAAPGGKASHIQALTGNQSVLTCNDNSKPRLMKLQRNMERLGAKAAYTLCDAARLSRKFEPKTFDKILLDAPCSGEGMMTLEDMKLFDSWSVAHIRRLSDLQKKILSESWQLLKPGGTLVYSTCTMAPEENETVIDYLLRKNPDAELIPLPFEAKNRVSVLKEWNNKLYACDLNGCIRLVPSELTEAFFVAKIQKSQIGYNEE